MIARASGLCDDVWVWPRHFVALRNLVAVGGIADIDQAAPINLDL